VKLGWTALAAGILTQAWSAGAAGSDISEFVGREFKGTTPAGIKWEATSEMIENAKSHFRINRGHLGEREIVWADKIKASDPKGQPLRVVTDIIEVPRLEQKQSVVETCYWADGKDQGKQLTAIIAVITPDVEYRSSYLNLPFRVSHAFTLNPSTGRLKKLDPSRLNCAPEDED
jgi:hypothetical protein